MDIPGQKKCFHAQNQQRQKSKNQKTILARRERDRRGEKRRKLFLVSAIHYVFFIHLNACEFVHTLFDKAKCSFFFKKCIHTHTRKKKDKQRFFFKQQDKKKERTVGKRKTREGGVKHT